MITDGENVAMFELSSDGIYTGHYFFTARGKTAIKVGKEMVAYFFSHTKARTIRGLTPIGNLGARWMSRQLGFKGYGVVCSGYGPCELFILMKEI